MSDKIGSIIGSIKRNISEPGRPFALGPSSERWNEMRIVGRKNEIETNGGPIKLHMQTPDSTPMLLEPGQTYIIKAPLESYFTSAQFFIDGLLYDGIIAFFTRAGWKTWNDIEFKVETALKRVIQTISASMPDVKVSEGWTDEERQPNTIVCSVTEATEEMLNTGNWSCRCEIVIRSEWGKITEWAKHRMRTAYARDVIMCDILPDIMSAMVDNLTVFSNSITDRAVSTENDTETRHWVSTLSFVVRACGSVIPDVYDESYLSTPASGGGSVTDGAGTFMMKL